MKKSSYIALFITIVIALGIITYTKVNHKIPDTTNVSSIQTLSIDNIEKTINSPEDLKQFDTYIEKPINVKGVLTDIKKHDEKYILTITSKNKKIASICNMQTNQNDTVKTLQIGEDITVKGIYKGYLIDMILLNCIIN